VQADPVAYVTALYDERLEEAARFEAVGNALAASRAHDATSDALRLLDRVAPKPTDGEPSPTPQASTAIFVPTPTPQSTASPEPSPTPTSAATPSPTARPATTAPTPTPATPKPTSTPKPTATTPPSTAPSPTPILVTAYGDVLYPDGSPVNGACASLTGFGQNCVAGTTNGRVYLQLYAKKGQSITVYVQNYDAARGGTYEGDVTVTVGGTYVPLGTITLHLV
jgi:outer membrane biosynthesis protein TonB